MKVLQIPYLPQLDSIEFEKVSAYMEKMSSRNSIETVNWPDEFSYHPITVFDIAYSDSYLYINYFVRGYCLRAVASQDNEYVYEDSCVEFFVRPEDKEEYYNLEFNCIGTVQSAYGKGREGRKPLALSDLAQIKRRTSLMRRPFNEIQGLFSWELLVAIPFHVIGVDKENKPDSLRANFYKCADGTTMPHYLSWAPVITEKPDFHRPEFFGRIIFTKK